MARLGKWLGYIILVLAVLLFAAVRVMPLLDLGEWAVVRSSSMVPALPVGALALMMPAAATEVKVGDVITFNPPWDLDVSVSHRVIGIKTEGGLYFDTKGDALEQSDPFWIPAELVRGKVVFHIPYLGRLFVAIIRVVRTQLGLALFVIIPSVVIVISTLLGFKRRSNIFQRRRQLLAKRRRQWQTFTR